MMMMMMMMVRNTQSSRLYSFFPQTSDVNKQQIVESLKPTQRKWRSGTSSSHILLILTADVNVTHCPGQASVFVNTGTVAAHAPLWNRNAAIRLTLKHFSWQTKTWTLYYFIRYNEKETLQSTYPTTNAAFDTLKKWCQWKITIVSDPKHARD